MVHPTFIDGFFSKQYYTDKKKGIVNPDFLENYARFCDEAMERGQIVVRNYYMKVVKNQWWS